MVDPNQPKQQSDTEILSVPVELALSIKEIVHLYYHNKQNTVEAVRNMISTVKEGTDYLSLKNKNLPSYPNDSVEESEDNFRKSWDDILNLHVYIDTDIFGELDPRPPALAKMNVGSIDSETVIQHTEATEAYVLSWKEIAREISNFPDDLFTRLWTTIEIAKILECSPNSLRRARRTHRLPIQVKDLILDCISHDGKRSLWFVRPS